MTIRQALIHGPHDLRVEAVEISDDPLAADEVLVRTEVTALSTGTDLGNFIGESTYIPGSSGYPRPVGYSNVGSVVQIGSDVTNLCPGQRVFTTKRHASACRVRSTELLVPVPDAVRSEDASLAYFAHLGLAALRQARYEPGESVAVVGLGVIGLCTAAVGRALGAKVIGVGNSDIRLAAAAQVGAHETVLSGADRGVEDAIRSACSGQLADVVVLTANSWNAYRTSMQIVRFGGRVAVLGFPGRYQGMPDFNPLDPAWLWAKRLSLLGSGYDTHVDCAMWDRRFTTRRNLQCILDLLASGAMEFGPLITHRMPAERMRFAYEMAAAHSKELITAVFHWNEAE